MTSRRGGSSESVPGLRLPTMTSHALPHDEDAPEGAHATPSGTAGLSGAQARRGAFVIGDRVQLTDSKGRLHTITLEAGREFHTHQGRLLHDALIGEPEGSVVHNTAGVEYLALRPLLADYVMSMPRGAAVVYPKDAGQIITMGDIHPGARVVEAGVGSGALSMSLLRAIGERGELISFERREDFADIAQGNVRAFLGKDHPAWRVVIGDLAETLGDEVADGSVDRVVLDMLAPWECLPAVAAALRPGGVLTCYVATTTQLSRVAEGLRDHGGFTEPAAWESLVRGWHLEGLAVRPQHRMHGHTGFLITSRRLASGVAAPHRTRRPAKGSHGEVGDASGVVDPATTPTTREDAGRHADGIPAGVVTEPEWTPEALGERPISDKKVRRARRTVADTSG